MDKHDPKEGYRVLVRVVSGLVLLVCLIWAAGLYLFRIGIMQTYFPDASILRSLVTLWLLLICGFYFLVAMIRGKFLWMLDRQIGLRYGLLLVVFLSVMIAAATPTIRVFISDSQTRSRVQNELDHRGIRDAGQAYLSQLTITSKYSVDVEIESLPAEIVVTNPVKAWVREGSLYISYGEELGSFGLVVTPVGKPLMTDDVILEGLGFFESH